MRSVAANAWCFASVVPNRKLLSAQLSKTLVMGSTFNLKNIIKWN
jgi:hypothetical protein